MIPFIDILELAKLEEQRGDQRLSGTGGKGGVDYKRSAWGNLGGNRTALYLNSDGCGFTTDSGFFKSNRAAHQKSTIYYMQIKNK